MASHITITPANTGLGVGKGAGNQTSSGGEDVFAALLGASEPAAATAAGKLAAENAITMSLGFGGAGQTVVEDPELIAAVIDATVPITQQTSQTPAKPELTELIEGLADLKARLEAGEPLDGEELKRLDALLANLAQQLDIDLGDMPTPEEFAALLAGTGSAEDSFANQLTAAFGPLASALIGTTTPDASAELSAQIKSVSDKLAAILSALNQGDVDMAALADMEQAAATDTELKAALDRLLKPTVAADAMPALATPSLDITETGLARTSSADPVAPLDPDVQTQTERELTLQAQATSGEGDSEPKADGETGKQSDDKPQTDSKPAATIAAAIADKPADTAAAAQPAPAARVDAVAAPRVVQTGYQTSQQQLNLPQLAFEMARQVNDGNTRFQIRLDPAELGKIDVRLDIDASGQVNARLTVERAETLDLMQRDQKALERALQQAGLDGAKTNLEFSLKQNPFSGGQQGHNGNDRTPLFSLQEMDAEVAPLPTVTLYRGNLSASGVNIVA